MLFAQAARRLGQGSLFRIVVSRPAPHQSRIGTGCSPTPRSRVNALPWGKLRIYRSGNASARRLAVLLIGIRGDTAPT